MKSLLNLRSPRAVPRHAGRVGQEATLLISILGGYDVEVTEKYFIKSNPRDWRNGASG